MHSKCWGASGQMLISCIVPAYHNKNELLQTVESALRVQAQTPLCCIKIIIIDGSIIPLLNNEEIHSMTTKSCSILYINEPDNGPYDAMNKGLKMSDGDWIWFLNSGDRGLSLPSWRHLEGDENIVIGAWISELHNKLINPSNECGLKSSSKAEPGCGLCHQAMLFKSKIYKNRFYRGEIYKYAAELDYYIEDLIQGNYIVDHSFVCSYNNIRGISQSQAVMHLKESLKIYNEHNIEVSRLRLIHRYASAYLSSLRSWRRTIKSKFNFVVHPKN